MKKAKLTSVHVDPEIYEQFKISCIKYPFNFNKLVDISMKLYNEDEEFRKLMNNNISR